MKTKLNKTTKVVLLMCLILTVLAGLAFAAQKMFSDSIGHWAEEIINTLSQKGVVNGYPDGTARCHNYKGRVLCLGGANHKQTSR